MYVFGGKIIVFNGFLNWVGVFCLGFVFRVFFAFPGPECYFLSSGFIGVE